MVDGVYVGNSQLVKVQKTVCVVLSHKYDMRIPASIPRLTVEDAVEKVKEPEVQENLSV